MFVLNKKTGLTWNVEGALLDRLLKSPDYEVVESKAKSPRKPRPKKDNE
ncbi:hypothetical protein [Bacillus halotolerans]|nr:hypothetical protein [Bacillus halotolerans]UTL77887.1 hypothetical protein NLW79_06530 [Bacillus halotolerans]WJE44334.1 hypothetical protein QRD86_07155 [Bacillus halotolerans]WPC81885.1 hypothetical protein RA179_06545 [Bacillus halotolerans]